MIEQSTASKTTIAKEENAPQAPCTSRGAGQILDLTPTGAGSDLVVLTFEHGFIVFGKNAVPELGERHCWLGDVRTMPKERRRGVATDMISRLASEARDAGFRALYAGVPVGRKNASVLLKLLRATGFQLFSSDGDSVLYRRGLSDL